MEEYEQTDELDKCPLEDVKRLLIKVDDKPSDAPVCLCCGGQADPRTPDEPCFECKVANAERIAEGDR